MIHQHHNRILSVIRNKSNQAIHLPAIRQMIFNFESLFSDAQKLANNLWKEFYYLQEKIV